MAKLSFTVDSALLSELGERLVESTHVALLELVKNAYDADAYKVIVSIIPVGESDDEYEITVLDNGLGMSFEQAKEYWMRIATTNKVKNPISSLYGRKKSGSKGIGRFSCRRLGTVLDLTTTAKLDDGTYETTEMFVDWLAYEPGTDVTEIKCEGKCSHPRTGKRGTKLVIRGGKQDEWSPRGWGVLKRRLMLLVINRGARRRGKKPDPGFEVSLVAPDFEESSVTNPREQLMDAGWGRIQLEVDNTGKAVWSLTAKRLGKRQITMPVRHPNLAQATADIAILPDDKKQFRNPSVIALTRLRDILGEWGGVHVRVDGIRVPPYGEGANDWLEIDRDRGRRLEKPSFSPLTELAGRLKGVDSRGAMLSLLSSHSHVGEVQAVGRPEFIQMKASREGLVGEESVRELREVLRFGIDWATILRDHYIRLEQKDEVEQSRQEFAAVAQAPVADDTGSVDSVVEYVRKEVEHMASVLPQKERRKAVRNIEKATDFLRRTDELKQSELRYLRLIAATSSLLLIFQHEVRLLLSNLGRFELRLQNLQPRLDAEGSRQVHEIQAEFRSAKKGFDELLKMTTSLSVDQKDTRPARLALAQRIERAARCFRLITNNYGIDIDTSGVPRNLKVGPILEAELFSIFLNTLSNAIKSVIARGRKKRVAIRASLRKDGKTKINILDTGLGVATANTEVFTAFVADPEGTLYDGLKRHLNPEDKYIVGMGSGLGLSIVREIVDSHKGTISFVAPEAPWKTNLEIVLP